MRIPIVDFRLPKTFRWKIEMQKKRHKIDLQIFRFHFLLSIFKCRVYRSPVHIPIALNTHSSLLMASVWTRRHLTDTMLSFTVCYLYILFKQMFAKLLPFR